MKRSLLHAIKPPLEMPDVAVFQYPQLEKTVHENFAQLYHSADELFEQLDNDDEEVVDLRNSDEYLLISALKLQQATTDHERYAWSLRYTLASIQSFGRPDPALVSELARKDLVQLRESDQARQIDDDQVQLLFSRYDKLAKHARGGNALDADSDQVLSQARDYLETKFQSVWKVFEGNDEDVLEQPEIKQLFIKAIKLLSWEDWQVADSPTAMMSVSPRKKTIFIGQQIPPLARLRVKALFAHEVLAHAQRSRNGAKINQKLAYGLRGYHSAEEGLGVLLESAIEGQMPQRVTDRYIDIELALGSEETPGITRQAMYEMFIARMLLRLGKAADMADRSMIRKIAWQHVNRIYRGSLGNEFVGVFTRDIAYYQGYQAMIGYLSKHKHSSFDAALDFILSGKFDPTNSRHVTYVNKQTHLS